MSTPSNSSTIGRTFRRLASPVALLSLVSILTAPVPARAQEPAQESTQELTTLPARPQYAPELVIAGQVVMRLRSRAGGLTPQERAQSLRDRLGRILTLPDLKPEDVQVRQRRRGQTASIYVRRRLLITVDSNLADANNSRPGALAEVWANNLRRTLPQINIAIR